MPPAHHPHFPPEGSHLARYARVLPAVEINSTFRQEHRTQTFARWAASVPPEFQFSLKLPRAITHDAKLLHVDLLVDAFFESVEAFGPQAACVLAQLPPKLAFDANVAQHFLEHLREAFPREIVLEPRHETWFAPEVERLLERLRIARVAADPPRHPSDGAPGGWKGVAYFRLHGSPRMYYSTYEDADLDALAQRLLGLRAEGIPAWCIFDNTTLGAATSNALDLMKRLR